jgi:hypothetical protein
MCEFVLLWAKTILITPISIQGIDYMPKASGNAKFSSHNLLSRSKHLK